MADKQKMPTSDLVDLSQFDTREKAEQGVWFDLRLNGSLVKGDDGQKVRFKIKGINDPDVQQFFISARKKQEADTPDEVLADDLALMHLAIVDWTDNFAISGQKMPFSKDAIDKVFAIPLVRAWAVSQITSLRDFMNGS